MTYRIRLFMEDHDGGTWDRVESFEAVNATVAEHQATELAIDELASGPSSAVGEIIASSVRVEFTDGDCNRSIEVRGTQMEPDISIY